VGATSLRALFDERRPSLADQLVERAAGASRRAIAVTHEDIASLLAVAVRELGRHYIEQPDVDEQCCGRAVLGLEVLAHGVQTAGAFGAVAGVVESTLEPMSCRRSGRPRRRPVAIVVVPGFWLVLTVVVTALVVVDHVSVVDVLGMATLCATGWWTVRRSARYIAGVEPAAPVPEVTAAPTLEIGLLLDRVSTALGSLDALLAIDGAECTAPAWCHHPAVVELAQSLHGALDADDFDGVSRATRRLVAALRVGGVEFVTWSTDQRHLFDELPGLGPASRGHRLSLPAVVSKDGSVLARGEVLVGLHPTDHEILPSVRPTAIERL